MEQYQALAKDILENGRLKGDRTGTGTLSVFGRTMRFDLRGGKLPLVTSKKVSFKNILHENLWFLSGDTNIAYLKKHNVKIWDEWATEDGDLGPVYGQQWRRWPRITTKFVKVSLESRIRQAWNKGEQTPHKLMERMRNNRRACNEETARDLYALLDDLDIPEHQETPVVCGVIDQVQEVIDLLKTKPDSRRILISAWNPNDLPDETFTPQENVERGNMALAPCHTLVQFYTVELSLEERVALACERGYVTDDVEATHLKLDYWGIPRRMLSSKLTQRKRNCALVA